MSLLDKFAWMGAEFNRNIFALCSNRARHPGCRREWGHLLITRMRDEPFGAGDGLGAGPLSESAPFSECSAESVSRPLPNPLYSCVRPRRRIESVRARR